jgi:inner membrane transporter RhtA
MLTAILTLLIAMSSIQFGASLAKGIFPVMGPMGATLWRLSFAALILALVQRSWRFKLSFTQWRAVALYGGALGLMNLTFYLSLARIPLGIAVALEFTGPLLLAVFTSKRLADALWIAMAALGLILIAPTDHKSSLDPIGMFFALTAGACWAGYIVYGKKVSSMLKPQVASSHGMLMAAVVVWPVGFFLSENSLWHPEVLALTLAVAVFSSALPYSLEMVALKKIPTHTFSILMSLEPALATLMGWLILKEHLAPKELFAIVLIVAASVGVSLSTRSGTKAAN